jgi:hypothetical protein
VDERGIGHDDEAQAGDARHQRRGTLGDVLEPMAPSRAMTRGERREGGQRRHQASRTDAVDRHLRAAPRRRRHAPGERRRPGTWPVDILLEEYLHRTRPQPVVSAPPLARRGTHRKDPQREPPRVDRGTQRAERRRRARRRVGHGREPRGGQHAGRRREAVAQGRRRQRPDGAPDRRLPARHEAVR